MAVETKVMRKMWRFVETSNPYTIVKLSDREIVDRLIKQVLDISYLSADDVAALSNYITARTALIRDLAQSKLVIS